MQRRKMGNGAKALITKKIIGIHQRVREQNSGFPLMQMKKGESQAWYWGEWRKWA